MTTPHEPQDPDLTEEEEREVAALLADAAVEGPGVTPPDVVARLDDVLAGLVTQRSTERTVEATLTPATAAAAATPPAATPGSVVPLDERRRRRQWPRVLLAAAAVVGGGYAVTNLGGGWPGGASSDSAGSAGSAGGATPHHARSRGEATTLSGSGGGLSGGAEMSVVPTVRRDHLAADVRRVVRMFGQPVPTDSPTGVPTAGASTDPSAQPSVSPTAGSSQGGSTLEAARGCPVPRLTDSQRVYQVRYRGAPAGLVVGPRRQGSVDVTVYACSDGGVRLSRTVPAP
jgi:hypothetical protein